MKSLIINQNDKQAIENILINIAAQYNIDNVVEVDIDLNKTAGLIQFDTIDRIVEAGAIDMVLNLVAKGGPIIKQLPAYVKKIPGLFEQIASKFPGYSKAVQKEVQGVLPGMGEAIKGTAKGAPGLLGKAKDLAKAHPVVTTGLAGAAAGKAIGDTGGAVAGGTVGVLGAGIAGAAKAAIPYALTALSFLPGLGIVATIAGAAYALGSDPEVEDVVGKWVDLETQKAPVSPEVKKQYVDTTLAAIKSGATTLAQQWKADYEKKQGKQPTASTIDELLKIAAPVTVKDTGDTVTTMEETGGTTEPKTKGILDSIMEFGSEVIDNAVYKLESLWGGQSAIDLQTKIADLLISKKQLAPQYKVQFIGYLSEFAKQGFSDIKQESAKKKEEEKATGKTPDQAATKTDQTATTLDQKTKTPVDQTVPGKRQLKPEDVTALGGRGKILQEAENIKGQEQRGEQSPVTAKPGQKTAPTGDTAPVQDTTKSTVPIDPATVDTSDPNVPLETRKEIFKQRQLNEKTPAGERAIRTQQPTSSYNSDRDKYGFGPEALAMAVLEYGPDVYKIYQVLKEIVSGDKHDIDEEKDIAVAIANDIIKEGGFFDIAEKVLDIANKVLTESPEANRVVREIIGKTGKNPEEVFKAVSNIAAAMLKVMDTVRDEKSMEKKNSLYLQVNSGTFVIRKGSVYYAEIEDILNKFAQEHDIDNVSEIELELSNKTGEVIFKKAFSPVAALASATIRRYFPGQSESWMDTAVGALGAGMTNMGYNIGSIAAQKLGIGGPGLGGTIAQIGAGMLTAKAWDMFFGESKTEEENQAKQQQTNVTYAAAMANPKFAEILNAMATKDGKSSQQVWLELTDNMVSSGTIEQIMAAKKS